MPQRELQHAQSLEGLHGERPYDGADCTFCGRGLRHFQPLSRLHDGQSNEGYGGFVATP